MKNSNRGFPYFSCQEIYPKKAKSIRTALANVHLTCQSIAVGLIVSGVAVSKKEIDVLHAVAKVAASKNKAALARSFLEEPKNTIIPERNVKTDTVVSNIIIKCMYLLLNYYITLLHY